MNILKRCIDYSFFLLTGTVVFQSLFFFANMEISLFSLVLATLMYFIFSYYFKDRRKINYANLMAVIFVWVFIGILFIYYRNFSECTYDGGYYHGNAMVNMLNGWNPFLQADSYETTGVTVWADYYPKATWIFSTVLIKLFSNLSAGMIISLFVTVLTALYGFVFVYDWKKSFSLGIICGVVLLLNPIAIEQMNTYYVDAILGNMTIILVMLCARSMYEYKIWDNILIVLLSVFMINIKFTGFGFAGIVNLVAWIYLFFNDRESFYKYTVSGVIMVLAAVVIVGYSPYLINIMKRRHIFYPIAGKNAEDVVTFMIPDEIKTYNFYHKFTYSLTSGLGLKANLKDLSFDSYLLYDERIGAMGRQFLKILIICAVGFAACFLKSLVKKDFDLVLWLSLVSLVATIVANFQNMWWFRYIPQIWAFVPIGIILLSDTKVKFLNVLVLYLVVFGSYNIAYNTIETDLAKSRSVEKFYEEHKGEKLSVHITDVRGEPVFWFDDYETARAAQYGVEIEKVYHYSPVPDSEPYYMHYYKVFVKE